MVTGTVIAGSAAVEPIVWTPEVAMWKLMRLEPGVRFDCSMA